MNPHRPTDNESHLSVDSPIVVYGASGHGKVVVDILRLSGSPPVGFVDDDERLRGARMLGLAVLGDGEWLRSRPMRVALGIGDNEARHRIAEQCREWGLVLAMAVHPRAIVAKDVTIGDGTVIMAGVVINPDARIGRDVIVNTGAIIEHDCEVGDTAHISVNATLAGAARVGERAFVGAGATVLPRVVVGARATVGAGACVTKDVPDDVTVVGVPARPFRGVSKG